MTTSTWRSFAFIGTGLLVAFAVLAAFLLNRPTSMEDQILRDGAAARGIDPAKVTRLRQLEDKIVSGQMTAELWAELDRLRQDSNPTFRLDVYGIASRAYQTDGRPRAIELVRNIKSDPDPSVRAYEPWYLMLVAAPEWRKVSDAAQASSDPEAQRLGRKAIQIGNQKNR